MRHHEKLVWIRAAKMHDAWPLPTSYEENHNELRLFSALTYRTRAHIVVTRLRMAYGWLAGVYMCSRTAATAAAAAMCAMAVCSGQLSYILAHWYEISQHKPLRGWACAANMPAAEYMHNFWHLSIQLFHCSIHNFFLHTRILIDIVSRCFASYRFSSFGQNTLSVDIY